MPITTDLSVSPYFDDYSENKDFYKVLFRPGVAVQTRELNQLQSILQKQIERFGDHVFKRGTIVDGCDITYQSAMQYVKLKDNQTDGAPLNVAQLIGYYVKDTANVSPLIASVQTVVDGYESRSPDLKTIYVKYINSGYANVAGVSTERQQFVANDTLTVYKPSNPIEKISIANASVGFSNSDAVVIVSSIAIQNSTGGKTFANNFFVNDYLTDGTANVQIVAVDTTSNSEAVVLRIKPRAADLTAANTQKWTLAANTTVQTLNAAPSDVATIAGIIGTGASALLTTGAINGELAAITVTQGGSGYYVLPTVSVRSTTANTAEITNANLVPQTFLTTIGIANATFSPVGTGYGVSVAKGVVYQKGYFSRVDEHTVVVEKYSNTGFNKAVGFDTTEVIINSNQDPSLLDNATGEPNETAPGANRLKLSPTLVVKTKAEADANVNFFSVVEFSEGNPYKQNQQTQYNILGKEFARRTFEESGNYVLDPFILNTTHANTIANEATKFNVSIDPGVAYIRGNRVETVQAFSTAVDKGIDTFIANNANISLNYGNYIRVKELGGIFKFNVGDQVTLYPTAGAFISGGNGGTVPSSSGLGTALGTARIRSLVVESGVPGTAECTYRLYLFDIQLATARNFKLVRSIFYNGTYKGVCDAVTEGGEAVLKDNNLSSLLYYAGRPAVKTGNNFSYIYRTIDTANNYQINAAGRIAISATGNETFPYTPGAALSPAQEQDLLVIPMANVQYAANAAGSVSCNATSTQVNGTSTSFTSVFEAGDFIRIANSSTGIVRQIASVANDTVLYLTTNASAYTGANTVMYFPQFVPLSLRGGRSANVDANANTLIINVGAAVNVATNVSVAYNVRSSNTAPVTKTVVRDRFIRLRLANNAASNTGPWVLGVPDVFHLKGVYLGSNATYGVGDTGVVDITNEFYVDHNQNENYYGYSYLYRKTDANTAVATTNFLLVQFDHFTNSGEGLKAPGSGGTYTINDGVTLASSSSSINTLEIPEVYGTKGDYYDLRDHFDFRPIVTANTTPNASAASAPINPEERTASDKFGTTDKKFPAPDSNLTGILEYYLGRADRVTIDQNGQFHIMKGAPGTSEAPEQPEDALTINVLQIPPYPSQPKRRSAATLDFIDNKIANETYSNRRLDNYTVAAPINAAQRAVLQPRGYTMVDIGTLERRIAALEYYTSFTLVEALTQKKVIPSSSNNAVDRFKFGFFVDGFNSYSYSETSNPQYNASIVDGYLSPKVDEINLPLVPVSGGQVTSLPYIEKVMISQPYATNGPIDRPGPPPPPPPGPDPVTGTIVITPTQPSTPTTVTKTISVTEREKNRLNSDSGIYYDEFFYTFSDSAGAAEFYINSRDNNIGVLIFQSQTKDGPWTNVVRDSGSDALPIGSANIYTKGLTGLNDGRKIEHPDTLEPKGYFFTGTSVWHEDQLRMLWTHNPDGGRYYMVRVYKGKKHGGFLQSSRSGTYGYKMFYPADVEESVIDPVNGWSSTSAYDWSNWDGSVGIAGVAAPINFNYFAYNPAAPGTNSADPGVIANEQSYDVRVTGLRPNTTHTFFLEGEDKTANCKQAGRVLGAGLQTDDNGVIEFQFFYYPTIETTNTTTEAAAATEMVAASKAVKLSSTDGTSTATTVLQVSNYIRRVFTAPPMPAAVPAMTESGSGLSPFESNRAQPADLLVEARVGGGGGAGMDSWFEGVNHHSR